MGANTVDTKALDAATASYDPQTVINNLAQSNPDMYAANKQGALDQAKKDALNASYTGGDQFTGGPTAAQNQNLTDDYNTLIQYGYTPAEAKANTYDLASSQYASSAATKAQVANSGGVSQALQAIAPVAIGLLALNYFRH